MLDMRDDKYATDVVYSLSKKKQKWKEKNIYIHIQLKHTI